MRGWILDLYPGNPGEMVVWLKLENGEARRLVDRWSPSIFVASDDKSELARLSQKLIEPDVLRSNLVEKLEQITDQAKSKVLEVQVGDAKKVQPLARRIEDLGPFGLYRIYNADVPPAQSYLYERDLFPLAYCEVSETGRGLDWKLQDDVWSYDYVIPELRETKVEVEVERQGSIARYTDPIKSVRLTSRGEEMVIETGSEQEKILELVKAIGELDPDLLLTEEGDTFMLPYMVKRAERNGVSDQFFLDRDRSTLTLPSKPGTSYFSYGKILFKPSAIKMYGRVHLDLSSSFVCSGPNLEGLFELSRICRMPLQTASRASIGKALSSLQFYHASRMDLLVPWKPVIAEQFKDRWTLMVADRGGFIFEPRVGLFEGVGELDFSSLYPNIMLKKNLSAETVRCPCCPGSTNRIPELDWNVCEKRRGIVPMAIEIIVGKRLKYKELKKSAKSEDERERYDARQSALKWLGVTSFGYLGYNNAKFGRIDAHIGVCAWDRKVILDAARTAERAGFRVIHGIVDSLWLRREGANEDDYQRLRREIEAETKFEISFEGIYKWVVFLPSRVESEVPVLNRYFGAYRAGELKVRGIEARRHDTPVLFSRCQMEILSLLAKADSIAGVRELIPECLQVFAKYAGAISDRMVPPELMLFTRNLSKKPGEYRNRTIQSSVAEQLSQEGVELHAGESVRYMITDYYSTSPGKRATAEALVDDATLYDPGRYVELLAEVCSTVLEPFDKGCSAAQLTSRLQNMDLDGASIRGKTEI